MEAWNLFYATTSLTHTHSEQYELEIPEEGLDYDLLDVAFNANTQSFISRSGIKPGMHVLDVGSGSGVMTHYLAQLVGEHGHVLSIDISSEQLERARRYCEKHGDTNITFKELSVYDLEGMTDCFDLIYCRFVLHHVHSPRKAISLFYDRLKFGGRTIAEEGIVSAAYAYPPSMAWQQTRVTPPHPNEEVDGTHRDGDFGMKLIYCMKQAGFEVNDAGLFQPLLMSQKLKAMLLLGHDAYKKTAIAHGMSDADWEKQRLELIRLAEDPFSIVGFYQSCLACGVKLNSPS